MNRQADEKPKPKTAVNKPKKAASKPEKKVAEKKRHPAIPEQADAFTCGAKIQPPVESLMKLTVYDNEKTGTLWTSYSP